MVEMRSALHAFARSMIQVFIVLESAGSNCWRYRHHESAVNSRQRGPAPGLGAVMLKSRRLTFLLTNIGPTSRFKAGRAEQLIVSGIVGRSPLKLEEEGTYG